MAQAVRREEETAVEYVCYHLHTMLSILDSCSGYQEYIDLAKEQGMKAIAFSEHGKPLQWTEKLAACQKAGVKFLHAVEIYLTEQLEPKVRDNYHTVLIAKNQAGVEELNRLMEISTREDHFYYTNRISFDEFVGLSPNIITTSACLASPLNKLEETHPRYNELVQRYDYLEVQPHLCDDQRVYNRRLMLLAEKYGKPLIAATDTHSATQYKAECRKILMKRKKKSYGNEDDFDLTWKTADELYDMFRRQGVLTDEQIREAMANTIRMADMCEEVEVDRSIRYPISYGSSEEDSRRLDALVHEKLEQKLADGIIPREQEAAFRSAIDEEMKVFNKLNMGGFMLSMAELIGWCRDNGIPIGTARGSVGGSRVAYVTDIIDLNPETWHTVFSRFCNEDRQEIGDIDTDCIESDRPLIFQHIIETFGEVHTARVASYGTIAELAAIEEIGGGLRAIWKEHNPEADDTENPWRLKAVDRSKKLYSENPEKAKGEYPELFYYFDGLLGTIISQGVHPAGMVIAPVNLDEMYGVFHKDGERCLLLDMDAVHEIGLAKYDLLILKTVAEIRDVCAALGQPYPRTHQINWNDEKVWEDMLRSPIGIFQMESSFAFECLKKFMPHSIEDMSLVTASIRPSGASYRDGLLARKQHHNPSALIDGLLEKNNGYLVYQEDIIKFLQEVCGLTGSEADNVRRAIGRKDAARLEKALPDILEGYCAKSDKPRAEAEKEAKEFLKVIEDASSYMFGYNHSIAYCLLGYICAYYRCYHPVEFALSFLNSAANDDDIRNGTELCKQYKIKLLNPRFGLSRGRYTQVPGENTIVKGVDSIKYMSSGLGDRLFAAAEALGNTDSFVAFLDLSAQRRLLDSRQLSILIHIDFFRGFGNQTELESIVDLYNRFRAAKKINREDVDGSRFGPVVAAHCNGLTSKGLPAKAWTVKTPDDALQICLGCEQIVKSSGLPDAGLYFKVRSFVEALGYSGYTTGREEDRPMLYVREIWPLRRKSDGRQFGYSMLTQSIGSGVESRFSVMNRVYESEPVQEGDIIICNRWHREGVYFTMDAYRKMYPGDEYDRREEASA